MAGGQAIDAEKRGTIHWMDPAALTVVGRDTKDGKEHPLYDERAFLPIDEPMVASIMAIGVRENVHVVIEKRGAHKVALVVDGRRRVLHAREANKRLAEQGEELVYVPTTVVRGDEAHVTEVMVALNEIRHEDEPLLKAAKAARMLERVQDLKQVARAFGVTPQAIEQWISLLTLSAPVKRAVRSGVVSPRAAATLVGLPPELQVAKLAKALEKSKQAGVRVSARTLAAEVRGNNPVVTARLQRAVVEAGEGTLPPLVIETLRWALGEPSTLPTVPGFGEVLHRATRDARKHARRKKEAQRG